MGVGSTQFWHDVLAQDFEVPHDRPLDELTAELTRMLGSPESDQRDMVAYPTLSAWIERGVYDDLLLVLGDAMAVGLGVGIGERDTDSVFRRSFSALVLAACIARDNVRVLLPGNTILDWGDRLATWYVREQDTRGFVTGKGWAHSLAHGADALGILAQSPRLAGNELMVLLDVIADRLLAVAPLMTSGEPDRLAAATMQILRRNVVSLKVLEPWVARIARGANPFEAASVGGAHAADSLSSDADDPYAGTDNAQTFLRALHLQITLSGHPPDCRPDLILVLVEALKQTNYPYLALPGTSP